MLPNFLVRAMASAHQTIKGTVPASPGAGTTLCGGTGRGEAPGTWYRLTLSSAHAATSSSRDRMAPRELCQQSRQDILQRPSGLLQPGQTESRMPLQVLHRERWRTCRKERTEIPPQLPGQSLRGPGRLAGRRRWAYRGQRGLVKSDAFAWLKASFGAPPASTSYMFH